jgi:succinate-semialdehyde dehydrogenase
MPQSAMSKWAPSHGIRPRAREWFVEHGPAFLADEPVEVENGDRVYVSFLPIGTVLAVMPWNIPLWQVIRGAGPIMLSGNGLLPKHATIVVGCAYALQDAYEASGFPKHLFANLNISNQIVDDLISDPRIAAVTVTGSNRAGSAVASAAGRAMKKSLLELGGSDAFIVPIRPSPSKRTGRKRHRGGLAKILPRSLPIAGT